MDPSTGPEPLWGPSSRSGQKIQGSVPTTEGRGVGVGLHTLKIYPGAVTLVYFLMVLLQLWTEDPLSPHTPEPSFGSRTDGTKGPRVRTHQCQVSDPDPVLLYGRSQGSHSPSFPVLRESTPSLFGFVLPH